LIGPTRRVSRRRFLLTTAVTAVALTHTQGLAVPPAVLAGGRTDSDTSIRVLLRRAGALDASTAVVSCESGLSVRDLGSDSSVVRVGGSSPATVGRDGDKLWVDVGDGKRRGGLNGPIEIAAEGSGRLRHVSSGTERAAVYRGSFEVGASPTEDRVALINVLGLEEYLAGVVPREMSESFGAEALRAQAVAARGFALARRANSTHRKLGADLCDAVDCQAYAGVSIERPAHAAALESTRGKVLLRGGNLFEPMYSSACGGHTEALSYVVSALGLGRAPLVKEAVRDGEIPGGADLTTDDGAATFFKGSWGSNCAAADRYRWKVTWERRQLEETLNAGLRRLAGASVVTPDFPSDGSIGSLTDLVVTQRGQSGRVFGLRIEGSSGAWTVQRDWTIRNLLRADGEILASGAIALDLGRDGGGRPGTITAFGAGWGHGVGMCQWGARGLAGRGMSAEEILGHYYPDTDLGPIPA
jgi:peptidoglycan hydrolase-like amidase